MSGSISGRYFCDLNDNDLDDDEPGIEGVRATLVNPDGTPALDQNGHPVASVLTDAQGRYSFPNLAPGTYDIVFDDPNGVLTGKTLITPNVNSNAEDDRDSDATGSGAGIIQGVVVVAEENTSDNDVGVEDILTPITGRVFDDRDCDGVFDEGDTFYEGLRIELLDEQGTLLALANSNFEGFFTLSSVPFGTYSIRAVAPSGYIFTLQDQGGDDSRDSDISALGTIGPFSVSAEEGLDFGIGLCEQPTGAISGRYFCDENRDDTEDDGTGAGLDVGVADKAVTLFDANGAEVASTRTTSDGTYLFDGLDPGDCVVQFEDSLADGKAFVAPDVGNDATDSDVDPATGRTAPVTVTSGQTTQNVDAGVADLPASIGGRYFCDENDDALEGIAEPGIAGVTIQLANSDGTTAVDIDGNAVSPVQTGADGSYLFTNLKAGTYVVTITDTSLPLSGKTLVDPNVGNNDSIDSDAIAVTSFAAQIPGITVRAGQALIDNDAGIRYQAGTIGGTVFCDTDCDGLAQDEPVKEGVTIQLLDAHGTVLDQMTTGLDGGYQFDAVPVGSYSILATAPDGTQFTIRDANGDTMDEIDSDVDATGSSGVFGLVDRAVLDIDIGLCDLPGAISGRYFCDENRDDTENDGTGSGLDVGVAGKTVTLYDANGGVVTSTTTQTDGRYQFADLAAGDYSVGFEDSLSEGKSFVAQGVGDDATDSDVDARGLTGPIRVVAGKEVTDVDAGVADLIFQVSKDISNIVAYLDCDGQDGDEIFKLRFEFKDNDDGINAVSLSQIQDAVDLAGYGDCEVLAATVKAGANKGGYGPGEGQFFDADPGDTFDDGTRAKADAQIHVTDDFASIFLFA